jgi:hypothetical protein
MSFTSLLNRGAPRNIRTKLLRDIISLVIITIVILTSIIFYQSKRLQQQVSEAIITDTTDVVKRRFSRFIEPIEAFIYVGSQWGQEGFYTNLSDKDLTSVFMPMMNAYSHISGIILANSNGEEFFLHRNENTWSSTRLEIGPEKTIKHWQGWIDTTKPPQKKDIIVDYDPRDRPWFKKALKKKINEIAWTDPYLFFTAKQVGITASTSWKDKQGVDWIFAIDLLQTDLLNFLNELEAGKGGHIILVERDGSIVAHNQATQNLQINSFAPITRAMQLWPNRNGKTSSFLQFTADNMHWWAGFSLLDEQDPSSWVVVIVPETEIMGNIKQRWQQMGIFVILVLGVGIILAMRVVSKYSYQLRDLPQQNIDQHNLKNNLISLIEAGESSTLEFKSTMRTNLKTGKTGKEIELAWLKGIVSFMNSDGGILLIGVADDGTIRGIAEDNFANEDKIRLHFKSLITHHIGPEFARFIRMKIITIDEHMVLVIECERVRKPIFLKVGKNEDFFVRSGPANMKMSMSQMIKYLEERQ